jgi:large subunit ribosomal protein L19e
MNLRKQKTLAAKILKIGKKRVFLDPEKFSEIKEAITRSDIKSLIVSKTIKGKQKVSTSKSGSRKLLKQKRKGRRKGSGSKKGKKTARLTKKRKWINKVRIQREFIKVLKDKKLITLPTRRILYRKIKGGFFRSKGHLKTYLTENKLFENVKK